MRKLIILLSLACIPAFAATNNVTSGTVFKLDASTGNDSNGGGFDATSSCSGTGGSDQTLATPVATTLATSTGSGSTTLTQTGGTWTSAMVCNVIQIVSGTNFTAGFYTIVAFTDSNDVVLNVSPCASTACTTGVTRVGGPLLTLAKAATAVVAGNTVYVKASATYTTTAGTGLATNGSSGNRISWIGYTSSLTDGGQPTLQLSSGSSVTLLNMNSKQFNTVKNFILDCNAKTTSTGIIVTTDSIVDNVKVTGCTAIGVSIITSTTIVRNSVVSGMTACAASSGAFTVTNTNTHFIHNRATGNACPGFYDSGGGVNFYIGNISDNNTGASSDGFYKSGATGALYIGNVAYLDGRDGYRLDSASALDMLTFFNNIAWETGGTCINSTTTNWSSSLGMLMNYNALGGGCTPRSNVPTGANDVTLTADPFVAGGSNNFALNNTSGGGPLLKSVGFPGVLQNGGTGYRDIGVLQSAPAVSSPIAQ